MLDENEIFKAFAGKNDVLVVDKSPTSRNRLTRLLAELGFKRTCIHDTDNLKDGLEITKTKKIGLVLSEYFILGGSGFEMFKKMREDKSYNPKLCFILVTGNTTQVSVARAAEEDVDSYVIKPYTLQSIKENVIRTVAEKIRPTRYLLKIEEGKNALEAKDYAKAAEIFTTASKMHKEPSLALFYLGQAQFLLNSKDEAQEHFEKGLAVNDIHFKCLNGLYQLMLQCEEYDRAYKVLKQLTTTFPANPERLKQVIHLAVRTSHFPDMNLYYDQYIAMEERDASVKKYIGAGLYVAGKHHLMVQDAVSAMLCFDSVAISCSELTYVLKSCVSALVEFDRADDAENILRRFPSDQKNSIDYLVADFLVSASKIPDKNAVIKLGLQLYNQNIRDKRYLEVMIETMEGLGYKGDRISPYREALSKIGV